MPGYWFVIFIALFVLWLGRGLIEDEIAEGDTALGDISLSPGACGVKSEE